jgi:hypothetical protein
MYLVLAYPSSCYPLSLSISAFYDSFLDLPSESCLACLAVWLTDLSWFNPDLCYLTLTCLVMSLVVSKAYLVSCCLSGYFVSFSPRILSYPYDWFFLSLSSCRIDYDSLIHCFLYNLTLFPFVIFLTFLFCFVFCCLRICLGVLYALVSCSHPLTWTHQSSLYHWLCSRVLPIANTNTTNTHYCQSANLPITSATEQQPLSSTVLYCTLLKW